MVIGFHYHIPIKISSTGKYETQSFYGLFLDALAAECSELVVFAYSPVPAEFPQINYTITSQNIRVIWLGPHNALPMRIIRFPYAYWLLARELSSIDVLLVRSPTPLLLIFSLLKSKNKIFLYIVGDYTESSRPLDNKKFKTLLIKALSWLVGKVQRSLMKGKAVITNSADLAIRLKASARIVYVVKSTTLKKEDIFTKEDTFNQNICRILYTGRLDPEKGLEEILTASIRLRRAGYTFEFHLAGLLLKGFEKFPDQLIEVGRKAGVKVVFHGLKKAGSDLNALYRMCDLYAIASRGYEGFPRTIWEAMANGLPVVASNTGSIPLFLEHEKDALLVQPNNPDHLYQAILTLLSNPDLRKKLITNGYALARENTLDLQAKNMIDILARERL